VSSGCIRLFNHDIIDLYNRAPVGTQVIVIQEGESMRAQAGPETNGYFDPGQEPIGPYEGPPRPYVGSPGPYAGPYYEPPPWASGY
jgi:L,D-transpeptidase catalytic domain